MTNRKGRKLTWCFVAGIAAWAGQADACHTIVHPGGPYRIECDTPVTLQLDGSQTHSCTPGPLFFVWSTDCPGAVMDDPSAIKPMMTMAAPPPCPLVCEVTLLVLDSRGGREDASAPVTVRDSVEPELNFELRPLAPRPPALPSSACSAPSSADFTVECSAADACDPAPVVVTELVVTECEGMVGAPRTTRHPLTCGAAVRIELDQHECRRSSKPRPPAVQVDAAGKTYVYALAVTLEAVASDACANQTREVLDPASAPATCAEPLPSGDCCPLLARDR